MAKEILKVTPDHITVAWHTTPGPVQLSVKNPGGTDITGEVTFATDNGVVAIVSAGGQVTIRGKGKCNINVTKADGSMTKVPVTVS
jgi:hypothetical protein